MNNSPCRRFRFFVPLIILAFLTLFTWAVFGLWNGVLVDVIGVKAITFWQALGILVLSRILFGSFPGRSRGGFGPPWRRGMMERWESMTPEQREEMRTKMRQRFGDWPRPPWCDDGNVGPEKSGSPTNV